MGERTLKIEPRSSQPIVGTVTTIPGDKSLSHRAVILGSLAENTSRFTNFLTALDCLDTLAHFKQMGVKASLDSEKKTLKIHGVGLKGLSKPGEVLDCGNSGTSIRLMTGVMAGQSFESTLTGDASIQTRPMKRVIDPLTQMGAKIDATLHEGRSDLYPPLKISPSEKINAISYCLPVASAQLKSAILLASLYSQDTTEVIEPELSRDHTEKMFTLYGADISRRGESIFCSGKNKLKFPSETAIRIPSDISSAAFFIVLAAIIPGSKLRLEGIGVNPTRDRICTVLQRMGAKITYSYHENTVEPVADIMVEGSTLTNIEITREDIPFLIDEIPILAVAALFGRGTFTVREAKELRHKESDRISAIGELITGIGGEFTEYPDGFELKRSGPLRSFKLHSRHDHRIAMSGIIAAIAAGVGAEIIDYACINTSFPSFFEVLDQLDQSVLLP